jgi:hypothetical protein
MLRFRRAWWVGVVLFGLAGVASAHNDGEPDHEEADTAGFIDCERPPADAIRALPAPLSAWAALECLPMGQKLAQSEDWLWRYPASWTTRPEAPAWAPDASRSLPGAKYFTKVGVETLSADAIGRMHERLVKESATYRFYFEARPEKAYRLAVKNNLGHEMEIFVPVESETKYWGFLCVPTCRPEYAFIMEKR